MGASSPIRGSSRCCKRRRRTEDKRPRRRFLEPGVKSLGPITAAALVAALLPASAPAASGTNGGAVYAAPVVEKKPKPKPKSVAARPQLATFRVTPSVLTPGQAPTADFQIKGRAPTIRLRLVVSWPGTTNPERQIDLGRRAANAPQ